jgi:hypothetical protein
MTNASRRPARLAPSCLPIRRDMGVILLEALAALACLVFIVWWTMFSGRRGGERGGEADAPVDATTREPPPPDEGGSAGR